MAVGGSTGQAPAFFKIPIPRRGLEIILCPLRLRPFGNAGHAAAAQAN